MRIVRIRAHVAVMVLLMAGACGEDPDDPVDSVDPGPEPFPDDCDEALNDTRGEATSVIGGENADHEQLRLCDGDVDHYRLVVPPGTWTSVAVDIDGSGGDIDDSDLDLWELDDPADPRDPLLDMSLYGLNGENVVWDSSTSQRYERLAWYNSGEVDAVHWLAVDGAEGAVTTYTLEVRASTFHDGPDCDEQYDDVSETGPCNRIMQFPQAVTLDEGYAVTAFPLYANLRREVIYRVRHAAAATTAAFPNTAPISMMDMSERDGSTPGTSTDVYRHPAGSHVEGNDVDVSYYQTGDDNLPRPVCPEHDGDYCTGEATLLDAERTAFFVAELLRYPHARAVGVDPAVAESVLAAAEALIADGTLEPGDQDRLEAKLVYGPGWAKHHHHLHFSWDWESGFEEYPL